MNQGEMDACENGNQNESDDGDGEITEVGNLFEWLENDEMQAMQLADVKLLEEQQKNGESLKPRRKMATNKESEFSEVNLLQHKKRYLLKQLIYQVALLKEERGKVMRQST